MKPDAGFADTSELDTFVLCAFLLIDVKVNDSVTIAEKIMNNIIFVFIRLNVLVNSYLLKLDLTSTTSSSCAT
jgi:hypothetical protein